MRYGWTLAAMVTVFFELCVVFYDEVECRAIDTHVTQSIRVLDSGGWTLRRTAILKFWE